MAELTRFEKNMLKTKKEIGKYENQAMAAAEKYMGDDITMRGAAILLGSAKNVSDAIVKGIETKEKVNDFVRDTKSEMFNEVWCEPVRASIKNDVKRVEKLMRGFVEKGDPDINTLLKKTDKYDVDVIAKAYVNVAKGIDRGDVRQMEKIDSAFNFEHPAFEKQFDFIRSHDSEADMALDFLDMEFGRERE